VAFEYTRCTKYRGSWRWYWSLSGGFKVREIFAVINKQHRSLMAKDLISGS